MKQISAVFTTPQSVFSNLCLIQAKRSTNKQTNKRSQISHLRPSSFPDILTPLRFSNDIPKRSLPQSPPLIFPLGLSAVFFSLDVTPLLFKLHSQVSNL